MAQDLLLVKEQYKRVIKHPFFSYMAITNSLIGEATGAPHIMPIWLKSHTQYIFKTKKSGSDKIGGSYSVDGGATYTDLIIVGDPNSFDDQVKYATNLFYRMGIIDQFRKNGKNAIDELNKQGYIRYH